MNQQEYNSISNTRPAGQVSPQDLAETLCHHLALDQQVLLRLFGRSVSGELNDVEFVALLRSFSLELPRRRRAVVDTIAKAIESGQSFLSALRSYNSRKMKIIRPVNFRMMEAALQSAKEQDALPAFLKAVSEYRPSGRPLALLYRDTMRKKLMRLAIKTFVILNLVVFILLFIVPELQKTYQEFGIELPNVMWRFMAFSDFVARYWFVLPLLFFILIFTFYRPLHPRTWIYFARRANAKFSPWGWMQRPLSKRQQRKLSFALSWTQENAALKVPPKLTGKEKAALKAAHSENVKSWLLSRSVQEDGQRTAIWKNRIGDAFITVWNLFLAVIVATVAFSIISCLTTIIEGFCGY